MGDSNIAFDAATLGVATATIVFERLMAGLVRRGLLGKETGFERRLIFAGRQFRPKLCATTSRSTPDIFPRRSFAKETVPSCRFCAAKGCGAKFCSRESARSYSINSMATASSQSLARGHCRGGETQQDEPRRARPAHPGRSVGTGDLYPGFTTLERGHSYIQRHIGRIFPAPAEVDRVRR
jgi:hypothetical protein